MCSLINLLAKGSLISDKDYMHFFVDVIAYPNYEYNLYFSFEKKKKKAACHFTKWRQRTPPIRHIVPYDMDHNWFLDQIRIFALGALCKI